ncbi:MAG: ferritin-like domain-containing protein [Minicystis sp.]
MHYERARGRYLAALGLAGLPAAFLAIGCQHAEPPATQTTAAATRHTEAWVPAIEAQPGPPRPALVQCPHGPFCVPQPESAGTTPAPAPHAMCAASVQLPKGIGPEGLSGNPPTISFDANRTTVERASDPGACCYQWYVLCPGGRALRGPEGPVTASATRRDDWLAEANIDVASLSPEVRAALAAHWDREAAFEHASVGSFARAALALLAVGAPPDLVAATNAAAIDEVEHARLGFALASAYGGTPRGPGALPVAGTMSEASLITVAVETFVDACAGESTAALALREATALAEDPAVRAILSQIAEDEERHAELAWRTVAWALREGGDHVAEALAGAMATLRAEIDEPAVVTTEASLDLAAHGVLSTAAQRSIRRRALAEVVIPCGAALIVRDTAPSASLTAMA